MIRKHVLKNSVAFIPLTTVAASVLNAMNWSVVNQTGLPNSCFLLKIVNDSDTSIEVSTDAATEMAYVAPNSTLDLPVQAGSSPTGWVSHFAAGTIFYIRGTAGTGTIALIGVYNKI
jgi:hypothetical protein